MTAPDEQAVERRVAEALYVADGEPCHLSWRDFTKLARAAIAARAQPRVGDGEVAEMVQRLRRYVEAIEHKDGGEQPPPLHVGPMMCANAMSEAADMLERLTSPKQEG